MSGERMPALRDMFLPLTAPDVQSTSTGGYAHVRRLIGGGDNPLRSWRQHFGVSVRAMARELEVNVRDYIRMERDMDRCEREDIDQFCLLFRLHPLDLTNDVDVMPHSVAQVLAERAAWQPSGQMGQRALKGILGEIKKAELIMAQVRAGLPGGWDAASPQAAIMAAMDNLSLNNAVTEWCGCRYDITNIVLEQEARCDDLVCKAQEELAAMDAQGACADAWTHRQEILWINMVDGHGAHAGAHVDRTIRERGLAYAARHFAEAPEAYGVERWPSTRRVMIEGRVYDWENVTKAFFESLADNYTVAETRAAWQHQKQLGNEQIDALHAWLDRPLTRDMLRAFANVCIFARECPGEPAIQRALQAFRPTEHTQVLKRVFKPSAPC